MTDRDDDALDDLVARWEESREAGNELSPEEVCRERPDLLDAVAARIADFRRLDFLDSTSVGGQTAAGDGDDRPRFIHGRYRLVEWLGGGSEGDVWLAHDDDLGRDVAIKITRSESAGDGLIAEARTLATLQHPHILKVFDVGRDGRGGHFIVTELMRGDTLAQRIRASATGRIPADRAIGWAKQIASALGEMHLKGLVHRDVKPINVLLDAQDKAVLADFGIAIDVLAQRTSSFAGSLGYKSPEQFRGELLDGRSDVFSLALVAHEMLSGRLPHSDLRDVDAIRRDVESGLGDRVSAAVPSRLRPVIRRALSPERSRRQASAEMFATELDHAWRRSQVGRWTARVAVAVMALAAIVGWRLREQHLATVRAVEAQTREARRALAEGMDLFDGGRRKVGEVQDLSRRIIEETMNDPFHRERRARSQARDGTSGPGGR